MLLDWSFKRYRCTDKRTVRGFQQGQSHTQIKGKTRRSGLQCSSRIKPSEDNDSCLLCNMDHHTIRNRVRPVWWWRPALFIVHSSGWHGLWRVVSLFLSTAVARGNSTTKIFNFFEHVDIIIASRQYYTIRSTDTLSASVREFLVSSLSSIYGTNCNANING